MRRLLSLCLCLPLVGCHAGPVLTGNGVVTTDDREFAGCERIDASGVGTLAVTWADAPSLDVTGDENLLAYYETAVSGDTLRAKLTSGSYSWTRGPDVAVAVKALKSVNLSGQVNLTAEKLAAERFAADLSGQTVLTLSGEVGHVELTLSGQSKVNARGLKCKSARVRCSGQSGVVLEVTDSIDASGSGQSVIEYAGSPADVKTGGSGQSRVTHVR